jgi:hypothetical protein
MRGDTMRLRTFVVANFTGAYASRYAQRVSGFFIGPFCDKKTAVRRFKRSSLRVRYCYKDPAEPPPSPYNKKNPQDNKRRP